MRITNSSKAKSEGYKRSRNTRVFAVAVSADESGEDALDWLMTELVEDGDEIVAIRIIEMDEGERHDPEAQEVFREDAHQLLTNVLGKNNEADDRRVSRRLLSSDVEVSAWLSRLEGSCNCAE